MPRRNPNFSPFSEPSGQNFKVDRAPVLPDEITEHFQVKELSADEQAEEMLSYDKVPTGPQSLEFGQVNPAADLEHTMVAHGEKTGAVKIERDQSARPEDVDMPPEIVRTRPPTETEISKEKIIEITNRNIETIQTKLREDAKMPLGMRAVYEVVLNNNLQKLENLVGKEPNKTASKNRGLTMEKINADSNRHQQTAEEKAILYEKAKPSSDIRVPAADQDWAARATKFRGYKEENIRDVHAADRQKKQDEELGGAISADEIAWFNKDKTETLTRTPDAPTEEGFFAKLKRQFTGK